MDTCIICLDELDDGCKYAVINNVDEKYKYHPECLELWTNSHSTGIITRNIINTYSIYQNDKCISTISLSKPDHIVEFNDIEDATHNDNAKKFCISCNFIVGMILFNVIIGVTVYKFL